MVDVRRAPYTQYGVDDNNSHHQATLPYHLDLCGTCPYEQERHDVDLQQTRSRTPYVRENRFSFVDSSSLIHRASDAFSSTSSDLASLRAISFRTPSTPTSSKDGDVDFGDDFALHDHASSPMNVDRTLRGIESDHPTTYHYEHQLSANAPYESVYTSCPATGAEHLQHSQGTSATIRHSSSPVDPCTPWASHYNRQSYPSRIVEEGLDSQNPPSYPDESRLSIPETGQSTVLQQSLPHLDQCRFSDAQQQQQRLWSGNLPLQKAKNAYNISRGKRVPRSGSPTSSSRSSTARVGIRSRPLSKSGRVNAKAMRKQGCCFRCFLMKERCVVDEESQHDGNCQRCRKLVNSSRTYKLACSQLKLDQRGKYVVPGVLILQLTADQVKSFIQDQVMHRVPNSAISLSLTMGYGIPLRLNAIEVVPRGEGATRMLGFGLSGNGSTAQLSLNSPPIIPVAVDGHAIKRHINQWLDSIIRERNSEFPDHCFSEPHEQWEREMLVIICDYHQESSTKLEAGGHGPYQTLRWALKLTVLSHIMCHPFVVPDDEIDALASQLRYYRLDRSSDWICPRLANRVIKSILLPMLRFTIDRVLDGLQKMLRTRLEEDTLWDQAFCVVFLCLTVVGQTQASLVERAWAGVANNDLSFTLNNAIAAIKEMEGELSTHLIGMFHHRFGTMKRGNGRGKTYNPLARSSCDRPVAASSLAERVRSVSDIHNFDSFLTLEIEQLGEEEMKEKNVRRLLASFMQPFFKQQGRRSPG